MMTGKRSTGIGRRVAWCVTVPAKGLTNGKIRRPNGKGQPAFLLANCFKNKVRAFQGFEFEDG